MNSETEAEVNVAFDKTQGHGDVVNHPFARYEQYGRFYSVAFEHINPKTGEVIGKGDGVVHSVDPAQNPLTNVPKIPLTPAPSDGGEGGEGPKGPQGDAERGRQTLGMLDIRPVDIENSSWQQVKHMVESLGLAYTKVDEGRALLMQEQANQNAAAGGGA